MTNKNYIIASLPFHGRWIVGATPENKIPSHGTHLFGVGYAYDFIPQCILEILHQSH